jgi:hypothetical protein
MIRKWGAKIPPVDIHLHPKLGLFIPVFPWRKFHISQASRFRQKFGTRFSCFRNNAPTQSDRYEKTIHYFVE